MTFDAFHLPGLEEDDVHAWTMRRLENGDALRIPRLRPEAVRRLARRLVEAREAALDGRRTDDVVAAVDGAAERLVAVDRPERGLALRLLPEVGRASPEMTARVLDRMAADWRRPALERLVRSELPDPAVLDGFRPDPEAGAASGRRSRATGAPLAFHVFSGNVPGVAVTAIVRSLLVRSAVLGKTASDDPVLPVLFARALAALDPLLGACLAVTHWPGGTPDLEAAAAADAETIVVYGGSEAVAAARAVAAPGARVVVHGPRVSLAMIARDALAADTDRLAAEAATAVALFDQRGCVSPHCIYVEEGPGQAGAAAGFAERLAVRLEGLAAELPRGPLDAAEASAILQFRGAAEFRGIAGGGDTRLHGGPRLAYTVASESGAAFAPSCLNRTVTVKSVASLDDVPAALEPYRAFLQAVALECPDARRREHIATRLARTGVLRVTTLRRLPWPPPTAHHDGAPPLRELLRWVDIEED